MRRAGFLFFYFFLFSAFQKNRLDIDRSPGRHIVLLILVRVLAENVSHPGFSVIIICFIFHCHVTRDPLSVHPDAGGGGKKGVSRFRQFCGPNLAIGAEKAVTAAEIQAPWVGAYDFGFAEGVGLNVHFLGVGGWLFGARLQFTTRFPPRQLLFFFFFNLPFAPVPHSFHFRKYFLFWGEKKQYKPAC